MRRSLPFGETALHLGVQRFYPTRTCRELALCSLRTYAAARRRLSLLDSSN
jgi:hypothetical protein